MMSRHALTMLASCCPVVTGVSVFFDFAVKNHLN